MEKIPVESSDLSHAGHDGGTETLRAWFHGGGVYDYYSVPRPVYDGLMSAESHGKYFHRHIKGKYDYKRL